MQRVLEYCRDPKTQQIMMDEILQSVCMLAQDQYGNYVVQVCCISCWFLLIIRWSLLVILFSNLRVCTFQCSKTPILSQMTSHSCLSTSPLIYRGNLVLSFLSQQTNRFLQLSNKLTPKLPTDFCCAFLLDDFF